MGGSGFRETVTAARVRATGTPFQGPRSLGPDSEGVTVRAASAGNGRSSVVERHGGKTQPGLHWLLGMNMDYQGKRIGPYRLENLLGNGGMGSVFLAVRDDDQFQMKVAVKLVRPDLDHDVFIRRFLHERQILADLKHPNIARLLDGGTTPEGLPYLVMEYVEGQPIDLYCRRHQLNMRERLELFLKVGAAVDFIHRNKVLHRDIKPGNILVTEEGEPILLDFGIAKILDPATDTPRTCTGNFFLTPQYASPEQFLGEWLGPESDVYSLGVLLYELLTGRLPFELEGGSIGDYRRIVCDQEPKKPSRVQCPTTTTQSDSQRSKSTGMVPDRDLDAVLLKALRKEPRHRYTSLALFTADLERYLQGYPVLARGSAWRYRAHKLFRRHRWKWVTAFSFGVMLLGFYGFLCCWEEDLAASRLEAERQGQIAQQALAERSQMEARIEKERRRLVLAEEKRAEAELTHGQVRQTLSEIRAERDHARKAWMELKQNETRSAAKTTAETPAAATKTVDPALDQLAREREKAQQALVAVKRDLARAEQRRQLAEQERDTSVRLLGLLEEVVADPQKEAVSVGWILDRCPRLQGQDETGRTRLQARLMNLAGAVYISLARYGDALPLLEYGLQLHREGPDQGMGDFAADLQRVGRLYAGLGFYERAAQLYVEALEDKRATFGKNHPEVAEATVCLAELAWMAGNGKKAVSLMQVALNSVRAACGSDSEEVAAYVRHLSRYCCEGAQPGPSPVSLPAELWRDFLEDEDATLNDGIEALGQALPRQHQPLPLADFNPPPPPPPSAGNSARGGGRDGGPPGGRGSDGQVARAGSPDRNRAGNRGGASNHSGFGKNDNRPGRQGFSSPAQGQSGGGPRSGGKSGGGRRH